MAEPIVSVVVPVHNAGRYVDECIDSLLSQTLENFELICVNDGSTDDSLSILERYRACDGRVKVLSASGNGAAAARNQGLSEARGKYVLFLDADDFFRPNMLELAVERAERTGADIVLFGARFYDDDKKDYITEEACLRADLLPSGQVFSPSDVSDRLFQLINPAPWTKLVRKTFIDEEGIRFQELPNSNDLFFSYAVLARAAGVAAVDESLVSYRVQTKSSTQDRKAKDPCCFIFACEALGSWLDERNLLGRFRDSFGKLVASNASYNYRTVEDAVARERILGTLFDGGSEYVRKALQRPIGHERFETYREGVLAAKRDFDRVQSAAAIAGEDRRGPTVSVVLPVYNCATTLHRSVESVLAQSFDDFELIIVDDASTDDTYKVAQEIALSDERIAVLKLPQNSKCLRARQVGVEASSGEYVMFLDGDDAYAPFALETVVEQVRKKSVDILHFPLETVSPVDGTSTGGNAFFEPYEGTIEGADKILEACFSKGLMNWNLVNKAFRGAVCRYAFRDLPAEGIQRGEDLVAFTFLAHYSESYRGIAGKALYRYYYGAGQDGDKPINLNEFKDFCASSKAAHLIQRQLEAWCAPRQVIEGFESVERRLLDNCTHKFKEYLPGNDKTEGLDVLFSSWGYRKSLVALMYPYWSQPASFAKMVEGTELVSAARRPIRNVAAYYRTCEGGGAENVLRQLTQLWLTQGYRVTWFLEVEPASASIVPEGVDVVIIPSAGGNPTDYRVRFNELSEALERYDIDAVVYHQWLSNTLLWDMLAVKAHKASLIVHCHGLFTNQMRFGLYGFSTMPPVYSLADGIVVINPIDKLFWSYFSKSVYQTNNILEDPTGYASHAPKTKRQVLWLGRLSPEKHPEKVVEIARRTKSLDPSIAFAVAGSATTSEYECKLQKMVDDAGVADTVSFLGWCDGQDKKDLFAESSVFLMTSEAREGFPLTLLESKAAGIPVVMFDLPYLTVLQEPEGILTVPQGDSSAAAAVLVDLMNDAELYQREAENAKKSAPVYLNYDQASFWSKLFDEAPTNPHASDSGEEGILWESLLESYPLAIDRWKLEGDRLRAENATLRKKVREVEVIKKSSTWRVGRVVTYLPRKAKRVLRKLRKMFSQAR